MREPVMIKVLHPGMENFPGDWKDDLCSWNTRQPMQKYLCAEGRAIYPNNAIDSSELVFYGEWEPPSCIRPTSEKWPGFPDVLHTPSLSGPMPKDNSMGFLSTDPYVFGDCFKYLFSLQSRSPQLRNLAPGSVILFGGQWGERFKLQTLFVVGQSIPWTGSEDLRRIRALEDPQISDTYRQVAIDPLLRLEENGLGVIHDPSNADASTNEQSNTERRLYFGVMHRDHEQYGGCFSFTPCLPDATSLFGPPTLWVDNLNPPQSHNFQILATGQESVVKLWKEVALEVQNAGLSLGVEFEEPVSSCAKSD